MGGDNSDVSKEDNNLAVLEPSVEKIQDTVIEDKNKTIDASIQQLSLEEPETNNVLFKNLYISDPGFATRAADPLIMTGAAAFLKYNNVKLNSISILGGLFPNMPEYTSKTNDKDQMYLGNDPIKSPESKDDYYLFIKPKTDPEQMASDELNFENNVKQKIKSYHEVIEVNKEEFKKLEDILDENVSWHYVHGTEDIKNMSELRFIKIANARVQKKDEEKVIASIAEVENQISNYAPVLDYSVFKRDLLRNILSYFKNGKSADLKSKSGKELQDYIFSSLAKIKEKQDFKKAKADYFEKAKNEFSTIESFDSMVHSYDLLKSEVKTYNKELRHAEKEKRDLELTIDARARVKKSNFYKLVKKVPVNSVTQELVFREVKQEYNELIYEVVPSKFRQNFHVHSSFIKPLLVSSKDGGKEKGSDMIYSSEIEKYFPYGFKIMLAYNLNTKSSVPNMQTLRMQKQYLHQMNKMGGHFKESLPDVIVSGNGIGGFRFQQQLKYSENTVIGEDRTIPDIVTHISLPTLLSYEKLDSLREKGLNVASVKRFSDGMYASGIVIHTLKNNYVNEIEYVDTTELMKMGEIELKIQVKEKKLLWKNIKDETKKAITKEIEELKDKIRINTKSIEVSGDVHIGSPNEPGRPTNYDFEIASRRYQEEKGIPDMIVISEYLHGAMKKGFDSDSQYLADVPSDVKAKIQNINEMQIPDNEKNDLISRIYENNNSRIPITRIDMQLKELKRLIVPHLEEILQNNGKVFIVSGNHNNKTSFKYDEAEMIASTISNEEFYEQNKQLYLASGLGEGYGLDTIPLENGKTLFSAHKPGRGADEVIGAMKQLQNANIDADIAVFFDLHHGGGGYADNTFVVSAHGKQTWNKFVTMIGKPASARGYMLFHYDPDKKYGRFESVLNPTLEKFHMPEYNRFVELKNKYNLNI